MVSYPITQLIPNAVRDEAEKMTIRCWTPRRVQGAKVHRYLVSYLGPDLYEQFSGTVGNARAAVLSRVLCDVPTAVEEKIQELMRWAKKQGRRLGFRMGEPWTDDQIESWILSLPRAKRERYHEAFLSLKERPFEPADAKVKCFVKSELTKRKAGRFYKPRMIQFRSARFLVHIARYIKPIEEVVYHLKNFFTKAGPECAKKMNVQKRGESLQRIANAVADPILAGLDCTAFDAHINSDLLDVEFAFYKAMAASAGWGRCHIGTMMRALRLQKKNHVSGTFPDGMISYTVTGNRMSGDLNTALGNTVIMCLALTHALRQLGVQGFGILDDGDDCTLIVPGAHVRGTDFPAQLQARFFEYGLTLKVDQFEPLVHLEQIEFCQSRPVAMGNSYVMVRDFRKVFATTTCGSRWHVDFASFRKYCAAVGVGDGILNEGVPVLQAWFAYMRRIAGGAKPAEEIFDNTYRYQREQLTGGPREVHIAPNTRASFALAFQLSPLDQVVLEEKITSLPTTLPCGNL